MSKLAQESLVLAEGNINVCKNIPECWSDVWIYHVPVGISLVFRPSDKLKLTLRKTEGEKTKNCYVKAEVRDATQQMRKAIYEVSPYRSSRARRLTLKNPCRVAPKEFVIIAIWADYRVNVRASYFELSCIRVREEEDAEAGRQCKLCA